MQNGFLTLSKNSVLDSVVNAVFTAVLFAVGATVGSAGFDVFTADWGMVFHVAINAGFVALVGTLGKNFVSTNDGKVFGAIPTSMKAKA